MDAERSGVASMLEMCDEHVACHACVTRTAGVGKRVVNMSHLLLHHPILSCEIINKYDPSRYPEGTTR